MKLAKPFSSQKPFRIECSIIFNTLALSNNTGYIIAGANSYTTGSNITCCKAMNGLNNTIDSWSYWFGGTGFGERHYGRSTVGQTFEFVFAYDGNKVTEDSANQELKGKGSDSEPKSKLTSDTIYFCYDPRDSYIENGNITINYLRIYQT